jgi:hypothetical protein
MEQLKFLCAIALVMGCSVSLSEGARMRCEDKSQCAEDQCCLAGESERDTGEGTPNFDRQCSWLSCTGSVSFWLRISWNSWAADANVLPVLWFLVFLVPTPCRQLCLNPLRLSTARIRKAKLVNSLNAEKPAPIGRWTGITGQRYLGQRLKPPLKPATENLPAPNVERSCCITFPAELFRNKRIFN